MNILKKIFSRLFKLSLIIIGITCVFGITTTINNYYNSDKYKYKSVIGKTFPIINELSSLVDIGNSSLKVLDNGDISIKFKMTPTKERLFKSASGNQVFFSLRDKDGFGIHTFSLDTFTKTIDANDDVAILSYTKTFEESSRFGGFSKLQRSLIHTDSIFVDSYKGLDFLEPFKVRQAAIEEERKKALEAAEKKRSIDEKSAEQKRRDKLYADNQKLLSESKTTPSSEVHRKLDFSEKISYENRIVKFIKIGMNYKEMLAAVGGIKERQIYWNKYHSKSKQRGTAYRYGDFVVYFDRGFVGAIEYEKL